jgi:hypothetical protein
MAWEVGEAAARPAKAAARVEISTASTTKMRVSQKRNGVWLAMSGSLRCGFIGPGAFEDEGPYSLAALKEISTKKSHLG